MSELKNYTIGDVEEIKTNGRTVSYNSSLALFWTGSGMEFILKASEVWIEVESDYQEYESWISILVNDVRVSRCMLQKGKQWFCVFRSMNPEIAKKIEIRKDTQAMASDSNHFVMLHSIKTDGIFLSPKQYDRKIEFIGDSITSGEGIIGSKEETDWISMWFDSVDNYTALTAKSLNAEYRVLSQSGWGVYCGWDNTVKNNIPGLYDMTCGACCGTHEVIQEAKKQNDFTGWQPDVVVINLGTNDTSAFSNEGWTDEWNGTYHKLRKNDDGSFHQDDLNLVSNAIVQFLAKLREYNPDANLVWAYGILGTDLEPCILEAIHSYCDRNSDKKVFYCRLPVMTEETTGARWHPGKKAHELAAETLAEFIRRL